LRRAATSRSFVSFNPILFSDRGNLNPRGDFTSFLFFLSVSLFIQFYFQIAARGDFEELEAVLKTLRTKQSSIHFEGSVEEICKGALLPFTKTVNLLFEVYT